MLFKRVLIYSFDGPLVWQSGSICARLVESIMGNVPVKLF